MSICMLCMWRSEYNLQESVTSFYRFSAKLKSLGKRLYQLSDLTPHSIVAFELRLGSCVPAQ